MGGSIQVPNNIEDKTVLKRFLTDLVLGINGNTLFSGNIQQQNAALVNILQNNPTLDFLNLVAKLNELRTDILTYVEDNLETVILQNTEDVAVIAEQFGTFYEQALAASWYGLSVKAGGAVAGLEIGSLDPDVTTPNDEKSYFRVVADNFIVGRAYEDLTQEEKDYLSANDLPAFGTVYNASKQPVPALITTWSSSEHVYKHYFNGIVQFTNISGTPTINKTYVQATAPSVAVIGDTWLNSNSSYASFTYNGSTWVSTGNKTYMQPSIPSFSCVAGDIWIDTDDNNISYRYNGASWISTRDTSKDASIAQALAAAANAQEAADGKIESFFQSTAPAPASIGDLWFDTDDGNKVYRYNGSTWISSQDSKIAQAISDAADAQATADGKITTYYQSSPPSSPGVGDLWVNSLNSQTYRWSFSQWILLDTATAINNSTTTINGGKITTNTLSANRLTPSTNGTTVWSGGGLVSQNFNGNPVGGIGSPTQGFRLSSDAGGSSTDPNIYGAYIKGGIIDGTTLIGGSVVISSSVIGNTGPIAIFDSTSSTSTTSSIAIFSSLISKNSSTGFNSRRMCKNSQSVIISAIAMSFNSTGTLYIDASNDGGSSWSNLASSGINNNGALTFTHSNPNNSDTLYRVRANVGSGFTISVSGSLTSSNV